MRANLGIVRRHMPISEASQPLYLGVYREIAREIESGALLPGDRLPSERWLCDELGVSRATVRRALEELMADGMVESRGRGSFVTGEALVEPPNTLMGLTELGRSRGLEAGADVLEANVRPATLDEAETFSIAPGRRAVRAAPRAQARRAPDLARPQPRPAALRAGARGHRLHHGLAVRRARPRRASARPRGLRARGPLRRSGGGGAAGAGAGGAGPVRDDRRHRR